MSHPRRSATALVAGGAGFLGSHLCRHLLKDGYRVVCADNFSSGSRSNVADLLGHARFTLIEHDITEPLDLEVDEIFNMACVASPAVYERRPLETLRSSVLGVDRLLQLATRRGAQLVQSSTSEIYGDPEVHPQREDYLGNVNPVGLRSCYDEGKRCAETLCMDYHRTLGTRVKIARIFNTYGPMMRRDDGRVVSNFIVQALSHEPITIYGNGSQTRSFCYVEDMILGLRSLAAAPAHAAGPINLGNPAEITVRELADRVIRATRSRSELRFLPLPSDDPRRRRPDISLATELLGWAPTHDLESGLERTIAHFKHLLRAPEVQLGPADASEHGRRLSPKVAANG